MGITPISCKCVKSCGEKQKELDLANGKYLRSRSGNFRFNNEGNRMEKYHRAKTFSSLFNNKNLEFNINEYKKGNLNFIKDENLPPPIMEESEEDKDVESKKDPKKAVTMFNINDNYNLEKEFNFNNEIFEKNNINKEEDNNNIIEPKNALFDLNKIKYIPNFDKTYFFPEKLKKAEKNFLRPINYEEDWKKYIPDDDENDDMIILINTMNNNKGINHTKEDGIVIEYQGEKYLYMGETDKNDLPIGFGILFSQGKKYEGNFFRYKITGLGRYIDEEGTCFEGIFEDNKLISKATVITVNENNKRVEYFGDVVDFKKNGKGRELCEDEYLYVGDFSNNLKNGFGELEYLETGDIYKGEFKNGEITGKGRYEWKSGEIYEGTFVNGIKHGNGTYSWPDGSKYIGEYQNGIREGKAKYIWEDGRVFKGKFKDGKPDGKGKITYRGKTVECEYKNGKPTTDLNQLFNKY